MTLMSPRIPQQGFLERFGVPIATLAGLIVLLSCIILAGGSSSLVGPPPQTAPAVPSRLLRFVSIPPGARITLEGVNPEALGLSPCSERLSEGPHRLSFHLDGHQSVSCSIDVTADTTGVTVKLEPLPKIENGTVVTTTP